VVSKIGSNINLSTKSDAGGLLKVTPKNKTGKFDQTRCCKGLQISNSNFAHFFIFAAMTSLPGTIWRPKKNILFQTT
jgi:hypothetical protein